MMIALPTPYACFSGAAISRTLCTCALNHRFLTSRLNHGPLNELLRRDLLAGDGRHHMRHTEGQQVNEDMQVEMRRRAAATRAAGEAFLELVYPLLQRLLKVAAAADHFRLPIDEATHCLADKRVLVAVTATLGGKLGEVIPHFR